MFNKEIVTIKKKTLELKSTITEEFNKEIERKTQQQKKNKGDSTLQKK